MLNRGCTRKFVGMNSWYLLIDKNAYRFNDKIWMGGYSNEVFKTDIMPIRMAVGRPYKGVCPILNDATFVN